jgi:hypothetical protein
MSLDDFDTGLKEYHKIGFGCVLINVNLFNNINIRCERDSVGKIIKGEDYCFSEDAKKISESLYVDTNSQVKHLMRVDFDWEKS